MLGFLTSKVNANEDYREIIKRKRKSVIILIILGILTIIVGIGNEILNIAPVSHHMNGVYTGVGIGLVAAGLAFILRCKKLLSNEAALKEDRLKNIDERNILISQKAAKSASMLLVLVSYVAMLIGGLFSQVIFYCFWWVVMIYLFAYLFFSFYYRTKKF